MTEPGLAYVGHLSPSDVVVLRQFDARIHELRAVGEFLDLYADGIPILCACVHSHYRSPAAVKRAFSRLANVVIQQALLVQSPHQGTA
jgi:hypothetical protein